MRELAHSELTGEEIDAGLSGQCITDLKGDHLYDDVWETERQYFEYRAG
jgi:hypothetical protein